MTTEQATTLQEQWISACESIDIPYITRDTAARIFAIVYVHGGGEEEMVLNRKFTNDVKYIQRRFGIQGGCVPEAEFASLLQGYVRELTEQREQYQARLSIAESRRKSSEAQLEDYMRERTADTDIPDWAHRLMKERYGMKLHG
jgi:hypothetical protein